MTDAPEDGPEAHTLGVLEELREAFRALGTNSQELYYRTERALKQLTNPNLHDIPTNLTFHVEMWDRHGQHIRWVVAAASTITIARAAYSAAVATYPDQHWTLRQRCHLIAEHKPTKSECSSSPP
jgi:hypothetical protein